MKCIFFLMCPISALMILLNQALKMMYKVTNRNNSINQNTNPSSSTKLFNVPIATKATFPPTYSNPNIRSIKL